MSDRKVDFNAGDAAVFGVVGFVVTVQIGCVSGPICRATPLAGAFVALIFAPFVAVIVAYAAWRWKHRKRRVATPIAYRVVPTDHDDPLR